MYIHVHCTCMYMYMYTVHVHIHVHVHMIYTYYTVQDIHVHNIHALTHKILYLPGHGLPIQSGHVSHGLLPDAPLGEREGGKTPLKFSTNSVMFIPHAQCTHTPPIINTIKFGLACHSIFINILMSVQVC